MPDLFLLHMNCGHVYCNYCMSELNCQDGNYECVFEPGSFHTAFQNADLDNKAEEMTHSLTGTHEEFQTCVWYFQNYVNYTGVPCGIRDCEKAALEYQCPYNHEENVLSTVQCRLGMKCWRGERCWFAHYREEPKQIPVVEETNVLPHPDLISFPPEEPPRVVPIVLSDSTYLLKPLPSQPIRGPPVPVPPVLRPELRKLQIQSKSVLFHLMKDNMTELNRLLIEATGEVIPCWVNCYEPKPETVVRWVFRGRKGAEIFSDGDSRMLESEWVKDSNRCVLSDGSIAFIGHMIAIPANSFGDLIPIARVGRLVKMQKVAEIEFKCLPDAHQHLLLSLQSLEQERRLEGLFSANVLLRAVHFYGISVHNDNMYGTTEALKMSLKMLPKPIDSFGFPDYISIDIPDEVEPSIVETLGREAGVLTFNGFAYGQMDTLQAFSVILEENTNNIECPQGMDEYELALLLSEHGLVKRDNKLFGKRNGLVAFMQEIQRREAASQARIEEIKRAEIEWTEDDLPRGITEVDIAELKEFFPDVRVNDGVIAGPKDDVVSALEHIESSMVREQFPMNLPYEAIEGVADKYQVTIKNGCYVGSRPNVNSAIAELTRLQPNPSQASSSRFQYHRPADWYLTQVDKFSVSMLSPSSDDYRTVSKKFMRTIKNSIIRVERIQNRTLYINFAHKHESYSESVSRVLETMMLFHGTSETDPLEIARSDEGLDPRIGGGMWGVGSYYAEKASYSHSYTHKTADGDCQMFLCEVTVGDYIKLGPSKLRKPPKNERTGKNYHTVCGNSANSDIWITYETYMSYPTYLITYKS